MSTILRDDGEVTSSGAAPGARYGFSASEAIRAFHDGNTGLLPRMNPWRGLVEDHAVGAHRANDPMLERVCPICATGQAAEQPARA